MERLQPRQESASTADFGKKILKLMLYGFLGCMTVVGLWFTILYTTPVTTQVEISSTGCILVEDSADTQTHTVQLQGNFQHYRLGNESDVFDGQILWDGRQIDVTARFAPGEKFAKLSLGAELPIQILMSRDQKQLLLEYALDESGDFTSLNRGQLHLLLLPAENTQQAEALLTELSAILAEKPEWEKDFHWKLP